MHPRSRSLLGSLVLALFLIPAAVLAQTPQRGASDGFQLRETCGLYFTFLGRTGAGREETFQEDPFGMGYCAGLIRGVVRSVDTFHPEYECRLAVTTFDRVVAGVVSYLDRYPDQLPDPDDVLVLRALEDVSVCARVR